MKVSIELTPMQVDNILNALEEKQLNLKDIYNLIFTEASNQLNVNREENKNMELIMCKDCGKEFEYTDKERAFFEDKGFPAPIRCKECRANKKARNQEKNLEELLKQLD